MNLAGQTVLITGGASGIGFALAEAFSRQGSRVVVCGRSQEKLALATRRLPGLEGVVCDLTSATSLLALKETLLQRNLIPAVLVNNAAVQLQVDFLQDPTEQVFSGVDLEVGTNFTGLVKLTQLMLPLLGQSPQAAVVNLTSGLAFTPKKTAPVYCATKAAVHAFSVALRYQLQDAGGQVRVLEAVLPLVDTPMTHGRGNARLKASPNFVAGQILQGLRKNQTEVHVGAARVLLALHRLLPGVSSRIMRNGL